MQRALGGSTESEVTAMKHEKLVTALWGFGLAFLISLSCVACIVTGFDMAVELTTVALWCVVAALLSAVCFTLPLSPVPLCTAAVTGGILWLVGDLKQSVQALLYRISRQYHNAYGWGILRLNHYTANDMEPMLWLALCFVGVLIAIAVAWAVCRRKPAFPGVLLGVLCLGVCLIVSQTVPDVIWLYGLLLGVLLLMLTHTVRREEACRGNRLSAIAVLPLAFVLLLLFCLVPQSRYTGQETAQAVVDAILKNDLVQEVFGDLTQTGTSGSNVSSGTVQLGSVGVRLQSQAEILQLHTDFSGTLYLRGRALDTYDGLTWTDSGVRTVQLYWPVETVLESQGEVTIQTKYAHRMLYLPYYVQSVDLSDVTRGMENTKKLTKYSFTTATISSEAMLSGLESTISGDVSQYLHLSADVKKWAEPLVREIIEGKSSIYDQAQAIAAYVRSSARYDLKTSAMPSRKDDFVKWFLEESDTGYCVHFASSAVVLLQAAGIPARYVTGYMTRVGKDCYTTVREMDAHAWAEYWQPGIGWTVLEATPPAHAQPEEEPISDLQMPTSGISWKIVGWVSAGVLLAAFAAVVVQRSVRLYLRRRRLRSGTLKQQILAHWQEAVMFARCLGGLPDDRLFAIAERAKFSPHQPAAQELEQFSRYLTSAREQLKKHSIFRKIYYRFVLALY